MVDDRLDPLPPGGGRETRRVLGELLAELPGIVYRCRNNRNWTMVDLAESIEDLTGYTAEELIGDARLSFAELIHPDDRDRVRAEILAAVAASASFRTSYRIRTRSGETRWVWEHGRATGVADGETGDLIGFIQDLTGVRDRRLAAQRSRLEETERQRRYLQLLQDITSIVNSTTSFREALDAALPRICEALDFAVGHAFIRSNGERALVPLGSWCYGDAEEFQHFREATESGDWDVERGMPGRVARSLQPEWIEDVKVDPAFYRVDESARCPVQTGVGVPVVLRDRALAVMELYSSGARPRDADVERLLEQVGVQLGRVWEREVSTRRLAESEHRLRRLAENMDAVFWISTVDGRAIYISPAYDRLTGGAPEPRDMMDLLEIVHPEDRDRLGRLLRDPDRAPYETEFRLRRRDGEVIWVRQRAFPITDERGDAGRIGGLTEDITARREAWEQLEKSSRLLKQTIASLEEAVLVMQAGDGPPIVVDVNPAAERIFGYGREELLGESTERLHVDREHFQEFRARYRRTLVDEGVVHASYPMRRRDGTVFEAEQTVTLLDPERGLEGGAVSAVRDVSEKGELERQLRQAQKMEALGRLAGGVAHDFNNLLTVIRAHSDFVLMELAESSPLGAEVRAIQDAADRAARLTAQLLAFGREQVLRPRIVDLNEVVREISRLLGRLLGEHIRIDKDLSAHPLPLEVDPTQLEQVIMNLAVNARDAMPEGGVLTLATAEGSDPEDWPAMPRHGPAVCLYVQDTGAGMDPETEARIFEPFYTTKHRTGTGLGLATAYGIVTQSGGSIQVKSEPGEGTTFAVHFPRAEGELKPLGPAPDAPASRATVAGRILVIEDDESVRRVVCRVLERDGLEVFEAADGETGLALLVEEGPTLGAVLTDLVLPAMSGRDIVERVRNDFPELELIVMSGYDEDSPGRRGDLPADVAFLQKPFTPAQLRDIIRNVLAR